MQYGICHLSTVPVRLIAEESAEMTTQLLYGDYFKVLDQRKHWSKIRITYDGHEGWIANKQYTVISENDYETFEKSKEIKNASDLVSFIETENNILIPILLGSSLAHLDFLHHKFEGSSIDTVMNKCNLINTALLYLNAPYLWGGKTPFGIDSSGLTQMVYKMNGYELLRNAAQQSTQGEALSFIEESEAGDLAFFDNKDGIIDHVGIIMENNYIIHAYGEVRIDRIDHTGIYNNEVNNYTHKLRVIKKVI
ncbi:MAG: hydrolase Nlp/P60 [Flavobacteriaceae bacterium]|nr:MAG: hydrolase Nlp/P60 [Flavobacteriaceae bacterium]